MAAFLREQISEPVTLEYFHRRLADGWVVSAVEWTKPAQQGEVGAGVDSSHEVPYGERIAEDCKRLVEDAREMEILSTIYDGVLSGYQPGRIASDLNAHGYRTRHGLPWSPTTVFELMPRVIELSPQLQRRPDWPAHRNKLNLAG